MQFVDIQANDLLHLHYHGECRIVLVRETEVNSGKKYIKGVQHGYNAGFKNFLWSEILGVVLINSNVASVSVSEDENDTNYYVVDGTTLVSYTMANKTPINRPLFIQGNSLVDDNGKVWATLTQSMVEELS